MNNINDNNVNDLERLVWACRRGMLELDLILTKFLRECFVDLNIKQKQAFRELLQYPDPELNSFFMRDDLPGIKDHDEIVKLIRKYARFNLRN